MMAAQDKLAVAERRFQEPGGARLHAQRGQPSGKDRESSGRIGALQPEAIAAATIAGPVRLQSLCRDPG
jgi:hypothetical protein